MIVVGQFKPFNSSLLDRARAAAAAAGMLALNNVTIEPVVMLYFTAW